MEPMETVERMALRKVVFGCCGTRFFAEFTLSVAEGLRMTKATFTLYIRL
jgi:hypothetical protein